jgi:hypothetical protein
MLRDNHSEYLRKQSRGVPRAGRALLQGILYCGECGHKLAVRYKAWAHYSCGYLRAEYRVGTECLRIPVGPADAAVVRAFLEALAPAELDLYDRALAAIHREDEQAWQARRQQVERLRYRALLAERQFDRADPDNRLVAAELERRWEAALRELRAAEEDLRRQERSRRAPPEWDAGARRALEEVGREIPELWERGALSPQQKKGLLRCLIDKVVVRRPTREMVHLRIVWKGGEVTTRDIPITVGSWGHVSCAAELEGAVAELARQGRTDEEIAAELTRRGYRTPRRLTVTAPAVSAIRRAHGVLVHAGLSHPRDVPGYLTVPQVARRLGVPPRWVYTRIRNGTIQAARDQVHRVYLFPDAETTSEMFKQLLTGQRQEIRF